ncbi:MAG: lysophospholipid acyltransferase family protein [Ignavibacteriota bacterium]|nr:lysophospholipid acyltransferase family protein [Ignavibacterium sp.]MCZ2269413.1 lysophospholipid acyltransferase family protein [Ignavibacteriales bacterium]MDX9711004.1 lysophospholipid acyltransferase family protein [Ignavibacteriaceae bacterium]QKJ99691.1 MAG: lysophospholipid acyltransferase family protein [Ignavibacteriota bacterium]MDD5608960.1 lysophospholipid acyltransferase family protein [Ignavibacterium sp.]
MKNRIEYILFLALSYLCRLIGLKMSHKTAKILAYLFFYFIPIRKDVVIDNLTKAFPDKSEKEIRTIAFNTFHSFLITLVEILYLPWTTEEQLNDIVKFFNLDIFEKRYLENNGLIVLSAHFGNWEYCAIAGGLITQRKFSVIVKPQRNPLVNDWLNKVRTKWNNEVVTLGVSIRNVFAVLMKKEIVAMVADQRGPEESIKLDFFGRKTSVYTGPAVLSLKMNTPLIIGIAVRQPDFRYKIVLEEISRDNLPENYEEKIIELSKRMIEYLESYIRKYPEQWFWMHRRWKH